MWCYHLIWCLSSWTTMSLINLKHLNYKIKIMSSRKYYALLSIVFSWNYNVLSYFPTPRSYFILIYFVCFVHIKKRVYQKIHSRLTVVNYTLLIIGFFSFRTFYGADGWISERWAFGSFCRLLMVFYFDNCRNKRRKKFGWKVDIQRNNSYTQTQYSSPRPFETHYRIP